MLIGSLRGLMVNEQFDDAIVRVANLLERHNLAFALIGGLASSIRGRIRVTADIDIVVDCEVTAAVSLLKQLDETSFRPFVDDAEASIRQYFILPIVDVDSGTPIDLAIGASGFEKMVVQRASAPEGYSIPVATAAVLIGKTDMSQTSTLSSCQGRRFSSTIDSELKPASQSDFKALRSVPHP